MPIKTFAEIKQLLNDENALGKVIESNIADDIHWIFFLNQFQYPGHYRPVLELEQKSNRSRIYNPVTNLWGTRKLNQLRGGLKHTQQIKKTAMTLVTQDGRIEFFGANSSRYDVGILCKLSPTLLHGQNTDQAKYVFSGNQVTNQRWWIEGQPDTKNAVKATTIDAIRKLNKEAREKKVVPKHNEVLVRPSKEDLNAIFARRDTHTCRLNAIHKQCLAWHWLQVDLPIVILTSDKGLSEYTEEKMVEDFITAFKEKEKKEEKEMNQAAYHFAIQSLHVLSLRNDSVWRTLKTKIKELDLKLIPDEFEIIRSLQEDKRIDKAEKKLLELKLTTEEVISWLDWIKKGEIKTTEKTIKSLCDTAYKDADKTLLISIQNQYFGAASILLEQLDRFTKETLAKAMLLLTAYDQHNLAASIYKKYPTLKKKLTSHPTLSAFSSPIDLLSTKKLDYRTYLGPVLEDEKSLKQLSKKIAKKLFLCLVKQQDTTGVKRLLARRQDLKVNYLQKSTQNSALHLIAQEAKPDTELFQFLYSKINAFHINAYNRTALLLAVENKHWEIVEFCLRDQKKLNQYPTEQLIDISLCLAKNNRLQDARLLLDIIATKKDFVLYAKKLLLHPNLYPDMLNLIIQLHPETLLMEQGNETCFPVLAVKIHQLEIIRTIFKNTDLMKKLSNNQLSLILLLLVDRDYNKEAIDLLKQFSAPIIKIAHFEDSHDYTLHNAVQSDEPDLMLLELLYEENQRLNYVNKNDETAFLIAAKKNKPEVFRIFMRNQADLRKYSLDQLEKIMLAFLSNGRDVEASVSFKAAMTNAAFQETVDKWLSNPALPIDFLQLIIAHHPPAKARALPIIVQHANPDLELVKSLYRENKDPLQKSADGKTAFLIAAEKNNRNMIPIFMEDKTSWQNYPANELAKIIAVFIKNHKAIEAKLLFETAKTKPEFVAEIDTWLKQPELEPDLLDLIIRYYPQKLLEPYDESRSFTAFLCGNRALRLIQVILKNKDFLATHGEEQLNEILLYLVAAKHCEVAIKLLENHPESYAGCRYFNTGDNALHIAVSHDTPNRTLVKLLCNNSADIHYANKAGDFPFLIAVRKNNPSIFTLFMKHEESKESKETKHYRHDLKKYPVDQLEKIIVILVKNKHIQHAKTLLDIAVEKPEFAAEVDKWLQHPKLESELLKLIIEYYPEKLQRQVNTSHSYFEHYCVQKQTALINACLDEPFFLAQHKAETLKNALTALVSAQLYQEALKLLKLFASIGTELLVNSATFRKLYYISLNGKPAQFIKQLFTPGVSPSPEWKAAVHSLIDQNDPELFADIFEMKEAKDMLSSHLLSKAIIAMIKAGKKDLAKKAMLVSKQKADFTTQIDQWMQDPNTHPDLLNLLIEFHPDTLRQDYLTKLSSKAQRAQYNLERLIPIITQNKEFLATLTPAQLGDILIFLVHMGCNHKEARELFNVDNIPDLSRKIAPSGNTALHLAVNTNPPDLDLIELLVRKNPHVCQTNTENETAFYIAAKKNIPAVFTLFMHEEKELHSYPNDQLANIIATFAANGQIEHAQRLIQVVMQKPGFTAEVDKWLHNPELGIELFKLILEHFHERLLQKYEKSKSFAAHCCAKQDMSFLRLIMQNKTCLKKHTPSQLGEILFKLVAHIHRNDAVKLLEECSDVNKDFSCPEGTVLHLAAAYETKPNPTLMHLLCQNNEQLYKLNCDGDSAFLVAAKNNIPDVFNSFMEKKQDIENYPPQQLVKIISVFVKNDRIKHAIHILQLVQQKPRFIIELEQVLQYPEHDPKLFQFILEHCHERVLQACRPYQSFAAYYCANNQSEFADAILKNKALLNKHSIEQRGDIALQLINTQHRDAALALLAENKADFTQYSSELLVNLISAFMNIGDHQRAKEFFNLAQTKPELELDQLEKLIVKHMQNKQYGAAELFFLLAKDKPNFANRLKEWTQQAEEHPELAKLAMKHFPQLLQENAPLRLHIDKLTDYLLISQHTPDHKSESKSDVNQSIQFLKPLETAERKTAESVIQLVVLTLIPKLTPSEIIELFTELEQLGNIFEKFYTSKKSQSIFAGKDIIWNGKYVTKEWIQMVQFAQIHIQRVINKKPIEVNDAIKQFLDQPAKGTSASAAKKPTR